MLSTSTNRRRADSGAWSDPSLASVPCAVASVLSRRNLPVWSSCDLQESGVATSGRGALCVRGQCSCSLACSSRSLACSSRSQHRVGRERQRTRQWPFLRQQLQCPRSGSTVCALPARQAGVGGRPCASTAAWNRSCAAAELDCQAVADPGPARPSAERHCTNSAGSRKTLHWGTHINFDLWRHRRQLCPCEFDHLRWPTVIEVRTVLFSGCCTLRSGTQAKRGS